MPGTEWTDIVTSRSRTISALSLDPIHPIHPIHGGRANGRESNADCFGGTAGFYLTLLCDAGTAWTGEGVVLPKAVTRAGVCRSVCRVSSGLFQRPFRHPPVFPIFYFFIDFYRLFWLLSVFVVPRPGSDKVRCPLGPSLSGFRVPFRSSLNRTCPVSSPVGRGKPVQYQYRKGKR